MARWQTTPTKSSPFREVARILKTRTNQIYELTRRRAKARTDRPLPIFKIHSKMTRVKKSDLMKWMDDLIKESREESTKKSSKK